MSSKILSNKPRAAVKAAVLILVLSSLGFIDASYLTVNHYFGTPLPCSIVNGCEKVTTSVYSTLAGVPISLIGAVYYLSIVIVSVISLERRRRKIMLPVLYLSGLGFLISLGLIYLQFFVLFSICLYCLTSAGITALILISSAYFSPSFLHEGDNNEGDYGK